MSRSRARSRACLRSEGGFALVEVMVSAVLLVVIALATYPVIDQSAGRSSSNRARAVAVSLAEQDQDRMRAMPQNSLDDLTETSNPPPINGVTFTINSRAQLLSDSAGSPTCAATSGAAQYSRISSTVTWPNMNGIDPVVLESLVSPNVAGAQRGTLVVTVMKSDGTTPNPGVSVTVAGQSKTTDATGCALFPTLPSGDTTVTAIKNGGYVGEDGNETTAKPVSIRPGETSVVSLLYDLAAGIGTTFRLYGTTTGAKWFDATYRSGSNPIQIRPTSGSSLLTSLNATTQAGGLFPFTTAGYEVYAGQCAGNDPVSYLSTFYNNNPGGKAFPAPGTINSTVFAYMRKVTVTVEKPSTNPTNPSASGGLLTAYPRVAVAPSGSTMTGCDSVTRRQVGVAGSDFPATSFNFNNTTNAAGVPRNTVVFDLALPWGIYDICVDNGFVKKTINAYRNTPTGGSVTPDAASTTKVTLSSTSNVFRSGTQPAQTWGGYSVCTP